MIKNSLMKKHNNFTKVLFYEYDYSYGNKCTTCNDECCGGIIKKKLKLTKNMRKLWTDHVQWTREFIKSFFNDLEDADVVLTRLLENQDDIGSLFGKYYGKEVGLAVTKLLKEHIVGAGKILDIVKYDRGEDEKNNAINEWYNNANEIADALYKLNTENWELTTLQDAMKKHLDDTLDEAVNLFTKDYVTAINDYESIHKHILMMADLFTKGILIQFEL